MAHASAVWDRATPVWRLAEQIQRLSVTLRLARRRHEKDRKRILRDQLNVAAKNIEFDVAPSEHSPSPSPLERWMWRQVAFFFKR